jgi:TolB-like protein
MKNLLPKKFISLLLMISYTLTLFTSVWASPPQQESSSRKNIAVIDLDSRGGLSASEVGTLTDRLRSMLVGTRAFTVVDRGKMDAILKEVGFQQTGCTTTECAVEIGKMLNVQQIVTGSLGKLGNTYTLDIVVLEVATSQIIKSFSRDYKGEIDGLLNVMAEMANQLAEAEPVKPVVTKKDEIKKPETKKEEPKPVAKVESGKGSNLKWYLIGGAAIAGGVIAATAGGKGGGGGNNGGGGQTLPPPTWPPQ